MVYAGPENNPTCWPVTTATVPGLAKRLNTSVGPFWRLEGAGHRGPAIIRIVHLARCRLQRTRLVRVVTIELCYAVKMIGKIEE